MTDRYLLYSRHGHRTGQRLGDYLGVPHGREMPSERVDYLLRWGTSQRIDYVPDIRTWNLRTSVANATDKFNALQQMQEAGIPVPEFSRDPTELEYPMLGRSTEHMQGNDLELILQDRDIRRSNADYFVQYVPTEYEYRAHVINSSIVRVAQKVPEGEGEYVPYLRNHDTGWVFVEPRTPCTQRHVALGAVDALDLDFGAVDLIIGEDMEPYVLEVNTAPSLNDTNLQIYGEVFAQMLRLDGVPGMDAVDWEDRDDVNLNEDERRYPHAFL